MKIRTGFVSNSSSTSFIVRAEGTFSTVKDVANYIMETCEWSTFDSEKVTLENMLDPNTPVHFNTGGDETYIRKVDDKIVISTTQNITFDLLNNAALRTEDIPKEWFEQFTFTDEYGELCEFDGADDFDYFYSKFNDYLILRYNLFGRHTYVDKCPLCNKGFTRGWKLKNNKVICECQIDKIITLIRRKEKINKINES